MKGNNKEKPNIFISYIKHDIKLNRMEKKKLYS